MIPLGLVLTRNAQIPTSITIVPSAEGALLARVPLSANARETLLTDILGAAQPLTTFGARIGTVELKLANGQPALATARPLKSFPGHVVVLQEYNRSFWQSDSALTVTLTVTSGFVVLILGFAFHWQSTLARETDIINDTVRGRIDTALNRGRCGLWDWDLASGRIFWSRSMFEILGMEHRGDLLTFGEIRARVHPDDIDLYDLANQILDAQIHHVDHSFRMQHCNGSWIWLRARCELTRPQDGSVHLIGIAVDITEQRSLAERSAEADLRLRDAIETIPEAFVLWDAENRMVMCNSHFQRLHQLPEDAVAPGTSYETIIETGRMPVIRTRLSGEHSATPGARTFEAELNSCQWLHISERRTKDGGYVSVGTDITTIKMHEKSLMDLTDKYAREKRRAEEANATKSRFLANMSHELRTPLNAIIGFSEIMESGMLGPLGTEKYQEYCRDILSSGQYLLEVINDILDMSRIEAGRVKFDVEDFAFDKMLDESMRVIAGRASDKKIDVVANVAADLEMTGDRRAIKQIAINLLSNAVKFTPDGGKINVSCKSRGDAVLLAISDTGIGIPKDALQRIGTPFEQVESQLTKTYHGSGLGLAIAKSLAHLHGGTMRIHSKLNEGTTVFVRLPIRPQCHKSSSALAA